MKIGFTGTISVGKTTLVKELSKLPQFKNYEISVERSKYLNDLGITLNTDSTLLGQNIFLAERSTELMKENIITDRTILDIIAFTKSASSINTINKEAFEDYACRFVSEYDYIFYINPEGVSIENNGIRETNSEYRDFIDFIIKRLCDRYKHRMKNFYELKGSTEERINQILNIIEFK